MDFTNLCPEIVTDILSRLPIESIIRCKSVCKSWYSLIQDPEFINLHLGSTYNQPYRIIGRSWNTATHLFLLDTEECKARQISVEKLDLGHLHLMSSCNGLLCMASMGTLNPPVLIYNPITQEIVMLPSSSEPEYFTFTEVGLGFDTSSGKYKALRAYIVRDDDGCWDMRFEVITFGERSWREVTAPHGLTYHEKHTPVFWNGVLYWILKERSSKSILAFGLSDEKFQILPIPDSMVLPPNTYIFDLLDSRECLRLVGVDYDEQCMRMWEVRGNKVGDLSLCLRDTYYTKHLPVNHFDSNSQLSMLDHHSWLLKIRCRNSDYPQRSFFSQFFPKTAVYLPLEITDLPTHFQTLRFKPTFVSPKAALGII